MPPEEKKERVPIKSLRTYQGDVEEAIAKNKYSSATILVAEQKRKETEPEKVIGVKYSGTRNKVFVYFGALFFILGFAVVSSIYYLKSRETVVIDKTVKTIIPPTKTKVLTISDNNRENLLSNLVTEKENFSSPLNSVLFINISDSSDPLKIDKILALIAPNQPSSLVRSFGKDYMIGVYSYDTNEIFIILTVNDYASSYSGMLKWEKDMARDLSKIYDVNQDVITSNTLFTDLALKNKDLRVLKDGGGKTQLLYSFLDKNTLIITKNEKIFSAILAKINISKQAK